MNESKPTIENKSFFELLKHFSLFEIFMLLLRPVVGLLVFFLIVIIPLVIFSLITFPYGGGLKEIHAANPKYQHPNKYFQSLVDMDNDMSGDVYWSAIYLENCDQYRKNWEKIYSCYQTYKTCEVHKPLKKSEYSDTNYADIFSKENEEAYQKCLDVMMPKTWQTRLWKYIGREVIAPFFKESE